MAGVELLNILYLTGFIIFGMKIENENKIRQIRDALGKAIGVTADAISVTRVERRQKPRAVVGL